MLSRYLPRDFDKEGGVALIAGGGEYPRLLVERMRRVGVKVKLVAFEEETEGSVWESFAEGERECVNVGQLGKLLKILKGFGVRYGLMAGQIKPKRLFGGLKLDWKAAWVMARLRERNAETMFGAVAREIEGIGVGVLDARSFMDEDMAEEGVMVGRKFLKIRDWEVRFGYKMGKELAGLDIGQSLVTKGGTVIAVEGFEGTNGMIRRIGSGEGMRVEGCLFFKVAKKGQDYRFDVPVFGKRTLELLGERGFRGACLEAGSVIVLNKSEVLEEARRLGVTVIGV